MSFLIFLFLFFVINFSLNKSALSYRSDETKELTASEQMWGTWSDKVFCNEGEYVTGFDMKGEYDDGTGANGIRVICNRGKAIEAKNNGPKGHWSYATCSPKSYVIGFRAKIEEQQNWGDDTALNSIRMYCSEKKEIEPSNAGRYGEYGDWTMCPHGSSVCGFKQKVEEAHGGDNTALNAVRLICCRNKKSYSNAEGRWVRLGSIGGGGKVKVKWTVGVQHYHSEGIDYRFEKSVTKAIEAGVSFMKASAKVSLASTASESIAKTMVSSITASSTYEETITCTDGVVLYQWVVSVEEDVITFDWRFDINSANYWCTSKDNLIPKCPFGYCKDKDCQKCYPFEKKKIGE